MRNLVIFFSLVAIFLFISCEKEQSNTTSEQVPAGFHAVKALESMDASDYTYINVEENGKEFWIAVPKMQVNIGDKYFFSKSMEMKKFKSETLNRTFESILFVEDFRNEIPQQTGMQHPTPTSVKEEKINIQKLKDEKSIAQIFSSMNNLKGKTVKVRGKVMKFNAGIMGTNWIHIQDGTSSQGDYDLLVTSDTPVELGKTIVAEGKLVTNKDFGSGYSYKALIENAKIKIE